MARIRRYTSSASASWPFLWKRMAIDIASSNVTSRSLTDESLISTRFVALRKLVLEIVAGHRQAHAVQVQPGHRAGEELAADGREHGVRENRVDHAAAALDLRAPADDQRHRG